MKRILCVCLMFLLLCGCASAGDAAAAPAAQTPVADADSANQWTVEKLQEVYSQHAREGSRVLECVIMEQSACEVAGVVQYTLDDGITCRFDYIKTDGTLFRMGMEFRMDGEKTLQFAGEDRVSCELIREDGSPYTATIIYYEDAETGEKGFRVSESE